MTNVAWMLDAAAREHPERTALIGPEEDTYTYAELAELSARIATALTNRFGIEDGDIVSVFSPNDMWCQAVMFGTLKAGAICTIENHTLPYEVLRGNVENTEPSLVLAHEAVFDRATDLHEDVAVIETIGWLSEGEGPRLQEIVTDYDGDAHPRPKTREDLAMINYTSGTSGRPKGAMLTHGMIESSVGAIQDAYHGLTTEDRMMMFNPMYHTGGISSVLFAVSAAATNIAIGDWDADRVLDFTETYDPTWYTYIAPTMARDLMAHDRWEEVDVAGIKTYIAGEPVSAELQKALQERGIRISGLYGLTETCPLAVTISPIAQDADRDMPPGAVGKPARELGEVKLVDLETGEEVTEPGAEGEICFRGDNLTPGYYNAPDRTDRAFDEDGWFHTNDIGYFDDDGYVYITGRADDMILSGAEKLSLAEVDDVLLRSALVEDGGTVGVPHERFGTVPAALVVPADPEISEQELADRLDDHMRDHLADWQRPRLYTIVEEIPRTTTKQTKITPDLEAKLPDWVSLDRDVSITTFDALRRDQDA